MKLIRTGLLLGILVFLSCKRDNETPPENVDASLLTKEIYNDELFYEYTYNNENLLKEEKTKNSYTSYSYNENHQLISYDFYVDSRIFSSNWATADSAMHRTDWVSPANTKLSGRGTYAYHQGKLESITVSYPGSELTNRITYDCDASGRITKMTFYSGGKPSGVVEYNYDKNGNLILETRKDMVDGKGYISNTTAYDFDDKKNPYRAFKRLMLPGKYTNVNNIIKETLTLFFDVPGFENNNIQVTESTYTHNELGYPILKNNMIRFVYN